MPNKQNNLKSKRWELIELAQKRRETQWPRYSCIGDYQNGTYECDHVSPYTKAANNLDADIFVLLQDWDSHDGLSGPFDCCVQELGYSPNQATNVNLIKLLAGHFHVPLADTYATNLFPFIKQGGMSEKILTSDLNRAAIQFALPQIAIVKPRLVICLGIATFNALRRAIGLQKVKNTTVGLTSKFLFAGAEVWLQAHTGALGKINRNRGSVDRVTDDWTKMAKHFRDSA